MRDDKDEVTGERYGMVRRAGHGLERMAPPSFEHMAVDIEMLLAHMAWAGVDKAVLFQAPVYGNHNEYYAEVIKTHPGTFVGYALVDPRGGEGAIGDLRWALTELGLTGVKIEITDTPMDLSDPTYEPFWDELERCGGRLAIDLGWDPSSEHYFNLGALRSLMERRPKLPLHLTHTGLGGRNLRTVDEGLLAEILILGQIGDNVMFDVAALPLACPDEEYPFPSALRVMRSIREAVGAEKIMWGSDLPSVLTACTYRQCLTLITRECDFFSERDKELILGENARRFYGF